MKLSIIIPTLQEESVLEKTLLALKKLKNLESEIIVSDGGSTDKTIEIAKKYANIVLIHDKKNRQTIAEGRNMGAEKANGEYLVFLDADVFILNPDLFFNEALKIFEKDQNLVALTVTYKVFKELETMSDKLVFGYMNFMHKFLNNYVKISRFPGEFEMIKKNAFKKVNGFDISLAAGEDYDLARRIGEIGKTYFEKKLIVYHTGRRAHKIGWPKLLFQWTLNSLSVSFRKKSFQKEWKVIR